MSAKEEEPFRKEERPERLRRNTKPRDLFIEKEVFRKDLGVPDHLNGDFVERVFS